MSSEQPFADDAEPVQQPGHGESLGPLALVVDDSGTVRSYHSAILESIGFRVEQAGNGFEALEITLGTRFDLLVVDVNMPVMDGYTLVESVRRQALGPEVPIIMISTEREATDSDEAYRRGANLYLVKPADPDQLEMTARMLTQWTAPGTVR